MARYVLEEADYTSVYSTAEIYISLSFLFLSDIERRKHGTEESAE